MQEFQIGIKRNFFYLEEFNFREPNHNDENCAHKIPKELVGSHEKRKASQEYETQQNYPYNIYRKKRSK